MRINSPARALKPNDNRARILKEYPIADYGLIGNCETAALINPEGGIDWLCLPAFDDGALCGALLDREKGGDFVVQPAGPFTSSRRYLDDSALLETRFATEHGMVLLTDFFVVARCADARFYDFTSLHPTRKLVRTIALESGRGVRVRLTMRARPDFGRRPPAWEAVEGGFAMPEATLFASQPLTLEGDDPSAEFQLDPGVRHFAVLDYSEERRAPDLAAVARWEAMTAAFWREWNLFNYYRGPHQAVVRRSAVTLKLLTFAPSGAFVAAPTTSLPEVPGAEANWDYRFTWLRDSGLLIDTLFRIGYSGEAKAFLDFVVRQAQAQNGEEGDPLGVLYAIRGGAVPPEAELSHLRGYADSRPIRTGNRAGDQLQLDIFAHVLEAFFYFQHTGGKLDRPMRRLIGRSIDTLLRRWAEPDNGVWEAPERRLFTYGKVMAWTGLATAGKLLPERAAECQTACATIRRDVLARGLKQSDGARFLAQDFESKEIDAASLLAFTSDFLPPDLARSTRSEIERRLGEGALVFRNERQRGQGEGAFLLCSFWLINHLIKEGQLDRAETLLDELLARVSPLGFLSEEIDPRSGAFRGNFPQAFSHLGLIGTILNLDLAKKRPEHAGLSDHEKFQHSVGPTVGWRGVLAGFFRVPRTLRLLYGSRSKWPGLRRPNEIAAGEND